MITPPDETYSTAQAASLLGISERQCARYLKTGCLKAMRPNGRWRVTALAVWQHLGIEQEMMRLWLEYCRQPAADDEPTADEGDDPAADDQKTTT